MMTAAQEKEVVRRYLQDERIQAIAREVGLHRSTVLRFLQRTGIYAPRWRLKDEELVRLYEKHRSVVTVAEVTGASVSGTARRLGKLGVQFNYRRPLTAELRAGMRKAFGAGKRPNEVAQEFDVSYTSAWRVREEMRRQAAQEAAE
jgi:hypothetical protein